MGTILAILPLGWAPLTFAQVCTLFVLMILQGVGFLNGLYILPCLLACLAFLLGLCGFKFERVSSRRNSGTNAQQVGEPPSEKAAGDDYCMDVDDVTVSPVRGVATQSHF